MGCHSPAMKHQGYTELFLKWGAISSVLSVFHVTIYSTTSSSLQHERHCDESTLQYGRSSGNPQNYREDNRGSLSFWEGILGYCGPSAHNFQGSQILTDMFSRWVEAFPLWVTYSETLTKALVDEVVVAMEYHLLFIVTRGPVKQWSNHSLVQTIRNWTNKNYCIPFPSQWPGGKV